MRVQQNAQHAKKTVYREVAGGGEERNDVKKIINKGKIPSIPRFRISPGSGFCKERLRVRWSSVRLRGEAAKISSKLEGCVVLAAGRITYNTV